MSADPKDTRDIPEVSPEKRGSLWNACYAAAYIEEYQALQLAARGAGDVLYNIDAFVERNAVCTAEYAKTMADIAVWSLKAWEKER